MAELEILRERDRSGRSNMQRDLSLIAAVLRDGRPRLRLYGWIRPTLSLGYAQDASRFPAERLRAFGVDLVRRPTGGRAVLHQQEVTYAFVVRQEDLRGDVRGTYLEIAQPLLAALRALGAPAELAGAPGGALDDPNCFAEPSWYEIEVKGRKLLGSAQVRRQGVILQHGALPLRLDYELWAEIFAPQGAQAYAQAMRRRAIDLEEATLRPPSRRAVRAALAQAFAAWWSARNEEGEGIAR